jgi:methylglutaconyl-CoA hydratase
MTYSTIQTSLQQGVALIWLNRPEVRNALNETLMEELTDAVSAASEDPEVKAIVLAGAGSAFCAGADLNWMKAAAGYSPQENEADALRLAVLLRTIAEAPKPVVARVHGPAFAGGLGIVCACDIAVAAYDASFCLPEVRIGLIPAIISPWLVRAMGQRAASRYLLSAEVFDAPEAYRLGLVQELVPAEELDDRINALLGDLLLAAPQAMAHTKRLIVDVAHREPDAALERELASRIAAVRASDEGREGIASFLEKRRPHWQPQR